MGKNNMKYRDIIGFSKKKDKFVKKAITPTLKPTVPPVTELLKKEFGTLNEWSEKPTGPKRWFKKMDEEGLTEFEKSQMNEGPAYEYARSTKNIEKSWKNTHKAVMGLVKELQKKGLKEEAFKIEKLIERVWSEFDHFFEETMDKLQ